MGILILLRGRFLQLIALGFIEPLAHEGPSSSQHPGSQICRPPSLVVFAGSKNLQNKLCWRWALPTKRNKILNEINTTFHIIIERIHCKQTINIFYQLSRHYFFSSLIVSHGILSWIPKLTIPYIDQSHRKVRHSICSHSHKMGSH